MEQKQDGRDIVQTLEDFIPDGNPRKWAKLQSTVTFRRLLLAVLRDILVELRRVNSAR